MCWGVAEVREDVGRGVGHVGKCLERCGRVCWGVVKCWGRV